MMSALKLYNVAGVVLAGGRSLRMGQDKALLRYHDKSLIDHMSGLLTDVGIENIGISGQVPGHACIPDDVKHEGPLMGLYSVLQSIRTHAFTHALVVPVDMPLLNVGLLGDLIQHIGGHDAVCFEDQPLPTFLALKSRVYQALVARCDDDNAGSRSIRSFLSSLDTLHIPISAAHRPCFENLNTPLQWRRLQDHEASIVG